MLLRTLLLISIVTLPGLVLASPITFEFSGTVVSATGIWSGQGANVTDFYVYDSDLAIDPDHNLSFSRLFE